MNPAKIKLVIATGNKDKFSEIAAILNEVLSGASLADKVEFVPLSGLNLPQVVEDGKTLEKNAIKKAAAVRDATGLMTLAEDTGLEVDYLGGAPGVYSARYAGPGRSYADNNKKLLAELKGVPDEKRTARFRCVAAVALPSGAVVTVEGKIEGFIAEKAAGAGGFGYDPIFIVPEYGRTFAEMTTDEKNAISHRAKAIRTAAQKIVEILLKG